MKKYTNNERRVSNGRFIDLCPGSRVGDCFRIINRLGGGVVIKPLFDIVSNAPTATINFYSSLAVFVMAIVALGKQLRQRFKFDVKSLLTISVGSVIGGFIGQRLLAANRYGHAGSSRESFAISDAFYHAGFGFNL